MTPRSHTRLVYLCSLIGFLAGMAFAAQRFIAGGGDLPFWVFPGAPIVLSVLPMAIGFGLFKPRCTECGAKLHHMGGPRVAWFCRACSKVFETGVPGGRRPGSR